jgi:hypothetical protein
MYHDQAEAQRFKVTIAFQYGSQFLMAIFSHEWRDFFPLDDLLRHGVGH